MKIIATRIFCFLILVIFLFGCTSTPKKESADDATRRIEILYLGHK